MPENQEGGLSNTEFLSTKKTVEETPELMANDVLHSVVEKSVEGMGLQPSESSTRPETEIPIKIGDQLLTTTQLSQLGDKAVSRGGLFGNFVKWLKNPSSTDIVFVQDRITAPAIVGAIVSMSVNTVMTTSPSILASFAITHPTLSAGLILSNIALSILSGTTWIASGMLLKHIEKTEHENRLFFSNLLSVSRVFTTERSLLYPAFQRLDSSFEPGFTGELHFVGRDKASWEGINTPLAAIRDGTAGLYNLAVACEQQDPRLEGVAMFGGVSPTLTHLLETYGFKIFLREEIEKPSLTYTKLLAKIRPPEKQIFPNGVQVTNTKAFVGVISREELVKHKLDFAQLARIDTKTVIG